MQDNSRLKLTKSYSKSDKLDHFLFTSNRSDSSSLITSTSPFQTWETEEVFHSGDVFFSSLEDAIDQAKKTIDFECYIFQYDAIGKHILECLKKASRRNVRVRILVDGIGSSKWSNRFLSELKKDGIHARIYHPLPWITFKKLTLLKIFRSLRIRNIIKLLWRLNRRDHRKMCIIDQRIAFVGGMNVTTHHLYKYSGKSTWRDTSVKIVGKEVSQLTTAFQNAWYDRINTRQSRSKWLNSFQALSHSLVRLNDTRRRRKNYRRELLFRILTSKKRVWITTPYFVPEISFIRALRVAAWSGVDVKILLPFNNDIFFMSWANRASYSLLLKAGVRIFEYLPSTLHAKTILIDEWATAGSSNRNHRSLIHDLEVDIVLTHLNSYTSVENQFVLDLTNSREITLAYWLRRPIAKRVLERLILFFRYWV